MIVLLLTLFSGSAHAVDPVPADPALHARVVEMLSGMESTPKAADWLALGPGAEAELESVARDSAAPPSQRGNALVALGNFPTDTSHALLEATLRDGAAPVLLRRKACAGLGRGWGAAAEPLLGEALNSPESLLRQSAARALIRIGDAGAKSLLQTRLAVETDASVKRVIGKGVAE